MFRSGKAIPVVVVLIALVGILSGPVGADTLWYNGDFDDVNGLANEIDTSVDKALVYDDFDVPAGGWVITNVWSNNLTDLPEVTEAYWEIRSGLAEGVSGTLVAGGGNSPATQTATGRSGFLYDEYRIEVSGLSILLDPGKYWLTVAPVGTGPDSGERSYVSTTSGANAVGSPPGNNDNSFFDSAFFSASFDRAAPLLGLDSADFSMGVGGRPVEVIPEAGTLALFGLGLCGAVAWRRRRKDS